MHLHSVRIVDLNCMGHTCLNHPMPQYSLGGGRTYGKALWACLAARVAGSADMGPLWESLGSVLKMKKLNNSVSWNHTHTHTQNKGEIWTQPPLHLLKIILDPKCVSVPWPKPSRQCTVFNTEMCLAISTKVHSSLCLSMGINFENSMSWTKGQNGSPQTDKGTEDGLASVLLLYMSHATCPCVEGSWPSLSISAADSPKP